MPSPLDVLKSFKEEIATGRLINDMIASLWRVAIGFVLSAGLGVPVGLWLGQHIHARHAFVPMLNFFRFLSPLAWIPFAILWFHIGDKPAVFLIFAVHSTKNRPCDLLLMTAPLLSVMSPAIQRMVE